MRTWVSGPICELKLTNKEAPIRSSTCVSSKSLDSPHYIVSTTGGDGDKEKLYCYF